MTAPTRLNRIGRILPQLLAAILIAGCATQRIDWEGRVGHYSYDQAVKDLGPPAKSATLTDGTIVAEWMTQRGYSQGSAGFAYGYGYPYNYYPPPTPDCFIRLTFDSAGRLQSWKRVMR